MNGRQKIRTAGLLRTGALMLMVGLVTACSDGPLDPEKQRVETVEVSPGALTLTAGESRALGATLRSSSGSVLSGRALAWSSDNETVASVNAAGQVTAFAPGTAVITAASEGRTGRATITVPAPQPVASLEIKPGGTMVLEGGRSMQLIAVPRAADGGDLNGRAIVWSSSDESVVWVSNTGGAVARAAGTAVITASSEGKTARVTVRVPSLVYEVRITPYGLTLAPGETGQLSAKAWTADQQPLNRTATWASEDPSIATVDAHGRVTAHRVGVTVVTATVEGKTSRVYVSVATWREHRLESVAGSQLPAQAYTSSYVDQNGVTRTVRVVVSEGVFRILGNARYEQHLLLQSYEGGALVGTHVFADRGQVYYHFSTGDPIFVSSLYQKREFPGKFLSSGGVSVTQKVAGEGPEVTLLHAAP